MKKKSSIKIKIFLGVISLFMCFLLLLTLLLITTFRSYVVATRRSDILSVYKQVNQLDASEYTEASETMRQLTYQFNVRMVIKDAELNTVFSPLFPADRKNDRLETELIMRYHTQLNDVGYAFVDDEAHRAPVDFISFVGKLDNGCYLLITVPVSYVNENIKYTVMFILMAGAVAALLIALVAYFFSRRITRPIVEISKVTEKVAQMDFSEQCTCKSGDEIGVLALNVNKMSGELEKIISDLKQEIDKVRKMDDMRKNLLINVSHELKTPIFLIQSYAEGLKASVTQSAQDRDYYCDVICDEAVHMNTMVSELLNLAKLEGGGMPLKPEPVSVEELVQSILNSNEIMIRNKRLQVHVQCGNQTIVADAGLARQALGNLIINALDHVPEEGRMAITAATANGRCKITVFNSGSHVPEEEREKIWQSFYKLDKSRNRSYGGTGIGLSIVRAVAESHHSRFGVENTEDGVLFYIDFAVELQLD